MLLLQHFSHDPQAAATVVNDFVTANSRKDMVVIDRASVTHQPVGPNLALNLALGAAAGLILGVGLLVFRERRPLRPPPAEAPGANAAAPAGPMVARDESEYGDLCRALLAGWFSSHRMLAIVGPGEREARANVAARLAMAFAGLGEKTLLVDAGADSNEGIKVKPVAGIDNLYLLAAPRERMASVVTEAGRRFRVVLIEVPAEQDGRHSYAALAGGALLVASKDPAHCAALQILQAQLARVPVRIVGTVVNPD